MDKTLVAGRGWSSPEAEPALPVWFETALAELVTDPVASSATHHELTFDTLPLWSDRSPRSLLGDDCESALDGTLGTIA